MKVGVHNTSETPLARSAQLFPLSAVERVFIPDPIKAQDLIRRFNATALYLVEAGQTVVWSFKPDPADVKSGAWKPHIKAFAQYLKDNGYTDRVVIVIWHEPENDPNFFKTGPDFVAYFDTVHDWLIEVDPSIVTSHAALGYYYRNISAAKAKQWVTKATIHSLDLYSGRNFPLSMTLATSKSFKTWKASRPAGALWALSERGWEAAPADSAARAASIDAESDYLASLPPSEQPVFIVVWNTDGTENELKLLLDAAAIEAVNRMFAHLMRLQCPLCAGTGAVPAGSTYVVVRS